ncbi:MAG: PIG-L deacetylase family protein [Solirubrobacterales bacterium]
MRVINNIKFILFNKLYFQLIRRISTKRPELISGDLNNILIIAPHEDDDVIGCGGLLAKNRGKIIKVVFITDGRYGSDAISAEELVGVRKSEAIHALNYLGINDIDFLGVEDRSADKNIELISDKLGNLEQYENIFIPNILDAHVDHKATAFAVYCALKKYRNANSAIWMYEIWSPLNPNVIIDISNFVEIKKKAINMHESQKQCYDYAEKIIGLNSYRAISVPAKDNVQYCEAYYRCSFNEFRCFLKL